MLPNNLTEKELAGGLREDGRSWRSLLAESYYKFFGEDICESCHGLFPYYKKILTINKMEINDKTCILKRDVVINEPWGGDWFTNVNITDEIARAYIKRTGNVNYFEKLPEEIEVIEDIKDKKKETKNKK